MQVKRSVATRAPSPSRPTFPSSQVLFFVLNLSAQTGVCHILSVQRLHRLVFALRLGQDLDT